jgi:hypothetical protein
VLPGCAFDLEVKPTETVGAVRDLLSKDALGDEIQAMIAMEKTTTFAVKARAFVRVLCADGISIKARKKFFFEASHRF